MLNSEFNALENGEVLISRFNSIENTLSTQKYKHTHFIYVYFFWTSTTMNKHIRAHARARARTCTYTKFSKMKSVVACVVFCFILTFFSLHSVLSVGCKMSGRVSMQTIFVC